MLLKNWSEHFSSEYLIWGGIHPFCSNLYSLSYRAPSLTAFVKLIWCHFWSQSVQGWFKVAAKLSFVTEGRQKPPSGQKMEKRAARGQRLHEPCIPPLHYFSQGKNFQQRHPPFVVIKILIWCQKRSRWVRAYMGQWPLGHALHYFSIGKNFHQKHLQQNHDLFKSQLVNISNVIDLWSEPSILKTKDRVKAKKWNPRGGTWASLLR